MAIPTSQGDVKAEEEGRYLDLAWKAQAGILYHQRLAKRYSILVKSHASFTLAFGMVGVASLTANATTLSGYNVAWLPETSAAIIAVSSALVLGFDVANRASKHADLARDWIDQHSRIETIWRDSNQRNKLQEFLTCDVRQREIDAREPPTKSRLAHWAGLKAAQILGLQNPDAQGLARYIRWF